MHISSKKECFNRRDFDEAKYMSFLMKDAELLGKYNETWGKNYK